MCKTTKGIDIDADYQCELRLLKLTNPETAHIEADELLLKLLEYAGYNKSVSAYRELREWQISRKH